MTSQPSLESQTGVAYWLASARATGSSLAAMFDRRTLGANVFAGLTVALVALPLNLALAIACGLPPGVGLVTGAIAGVVGALVGASRFQITGPEVALTPITIEIVHRYGVEGLVTVTFLAGLMQVAFGVLRIGRVVNAIPVPVIGGFLAAVGLLVFDSQVPRLLGMPSEVSAVSAIRDVGALGAVDPTAIVVGAGVAATMWGLPKLSKRLPAPLVALALAVGVVSLFGLELPRVTAIDGALPTPSLPPFARVDVVALLPEAVALATLASIDSLLCAVSIDARTGGERTRSDQELVAQGFANLASAFFGGMPVAAAVVRSAAAVEAGASSRIAPIVQSLVLGLVLLVLAPFVSFVPVVALAAILLVVGYRLIDLPQIVRLWRVARFESGVLAMTAAGILFTDFVVGVGIGLAAALTHFARQQRLALAPHVVEHGEATVPGAPPAPPSERGARVVRLAGPLFFGSQDRVEDILRVAAASDDVVVDVSGVSTLDVSGARALTNALRQLAQRRRVRLTGVGGGRDDVLQWVVDELEPDGVHVLDDDAARLATRSMPTWRFSPVEARQVGADGRWLEPLTHSNGSSGSL